MDRSQKIAAKMAGAQGIRLVRIVRAAVVLGVLGACGLISYGISSLYDSAELLWTFNARYNPHSVIVLCEVAAAKIAGRTPDLAGAADFINLALRVNPNDTLPYQRASEMYFRAGDIEAAVDSLRKAEARMSPLELDSLLHHRRDAIDAQAHRASILRPELERGRALEIARQWDAAIAFYTGIINAHPGEIDARLRLGYSLQHGKLDFAGAEKIYRDVLALKPDSADAWLFLGFVLRDMKRTTDAVEAFQKAIALDPNIMSAHPELLDPDQ